MAGANNITLAGHWNNLNDPNSFDPGTGTFTLNGTSHQNVGAGAFYNLTVNNSAGVSLGGVVGQLLTLQNGNITTGRLSIFGSGSGVTRVSGSGVTRVSGHVIGTMTKYFGFGSSVTQTFEVGTAGSYTPLTLTLNNVTEDSEIEAEALAGDHSAMASSTLNAGKSVNLNWRLNNLEAQFSSFTATCNFTAGNLDAGVNTNNLNAGKFLDPSWTYPAVSSRTATSLTLADASLPEEEEVFFQLAEPATGTIFAGLTNTALGGASLSLDLNNHLVLSNIGASGNDGVSINFTQAQFGVVNFGPLNLSPGAFVRATAIGSLNNVPGQVLSRITATGTAGGNTNIQFDLSAVGAAGPDMIVYNGATQVFRGVVPGNYLEVVGRTGPDWYPFVPQGAGALAEVRLGQKLGIIIPGGPTVTGDRIMALAEVLHQGPDYLSEIAVTAAGISTLTLESEPLGMFNFPHEAAGAAQLNAVPGQLTVSNLGSGLLDGVHIDVEEAGGVTPCFLVGLAAVPLSGVNEQVHFEAHLACEVGLAHNKSSSLASPCSASPTSLDLLATGSGFNVNVDYSPINASLVEVTVFNAGVPVGSAIVPAGNVGTITATGNPIALTRTFIEATGAVNPCMDVGFQFPVGFAFPTSALAKSDLGTTALQNLQNPAAQVGLHSTLVGDEIHFHAVNPTVSVSGLTEVELKMANVPQFTIIDEESEAPPARVLVSKGAITIDRSKHSASKGDLHSNATITFKKGDPTTFTGNLSAVGKITIDKDNTIMGNATSGSTITVASGSNITGTRSPNDDVANIPISVASFSAGGQNITVPKNGTRSLNPGSYGNVILNNSAKLNLKSGEYRFVKLETGSSCFLNFEVSNGGVQVKVTSSLKFGAEVTVTITPGGETNSSAVDFITLQTSQVVISKESYMLATITAPNAEVLVSKNTSLRGAIAANKITVERDVIFWHHSTPGTLPLAKLFADAAETSGQQPVTSYQLEQNYPNPFNPSTVISFQLPVNSEVSLKIYNLQGQLVREVVHGQYESGRHSVVWDGKDRRGLQVASGVYLYVLKAGDFVAKKKLVLMK